MVLLLTASLLDLCCSAPVAERSSAMLAWSRKVRKLSMLDVSIMGCFIVTMSLRGMRVNGVMVTTCSGVVFLLSAELCHYAAASVAHHLHNITLSARNPSKEIVMPAQDDKLAN